MGKKQLLAVKTRTGEKINYKDLRRNGEAPAVLYGKNEKNQDLIVPIINLEKAYEEVGSSSLIDLAIDKQAPIKAIIKSLQRDPVKNSILHADFYQVDMQEKIEVETPLHFIGEARAVKELGGVLVKSLDSVLVRCLPGELLDNIEVDLSVLDNFESSIKVSDLKFPENVELITQASAMVASVVEPKVEQEPEPAPQAEVVDEKAAKENKETEAGTKK